MRLEEFQPHPLNQRALVLGEVQLMGTTAIVHDQRQPVVVMSSKTLEGMDVTPVVFVVPPHAPDALASALRHVSHQALVQFRAES